MKHTIHATIAAGLIVVAACSGSDGGAAPDDTTAPATAPTPTTTDTTAPTTAAPAESPTFDAAADDPLGLPPIPSGDDWPSRAGVAGDPDDPEPFGSTGGDLRDIITADDPSAFACLESLGRGLEEILEPGKGAYEEVPDAHLFRADFTDGTSIDIRVHPEVGTSEEIAAEVDRYLVPLGQLPTVLRRDIERFAIRLGDETATGSYLEGISVQTGNMDERIETDRLTETLFHEAVHTGMDPRFAYGHSAAWLAAQAADGKFLTEYARENPDQEDLAESMLYAYAASRHPDRFSAADLAEITERIPNRIAFIESILPPDGPIFQQVGPEPDCG